MNYNDLTTEQLITLADKATSRTNNIISHIKQVQKDHTKILTPQDFNEWYCHDLSL